MKKIIICFLQLTIIMGLNIDDRLILSGNNMVEIGEAISNVPNNQLPGMIWLIDNMPEDDLKILSSEFLLTNCDLAYNVWTNSKWGDDIPENINIDYNNNHIDVTLLDSLNNLDSKLLFFLIYNFNRLLEYNDKLTNKSTLALLIVRIIEFNFDQYYLPYENIEVRKLETLININAPNIDDSLRVVSSFEEIYNSQEIDDMPSNMTEDEIKEMRYDMQEENDALDLDGYGNGDEDDEDAYMPESEMD